MQISIFCTMNWYWVGVAVSVCAQAGAPARNISSPATAAISVPLAMINIFLAQDPRDIVTEPPEVRSTTMVFWRRTLSRV